MRVHMKDAIGPLFADLILLCRPRGASDEHPGTCSLLSSWIPYPYMWHDILAGHVAPWHVGIDVKSACLLQGCFWLRFHQACTSTEGGLKATL